MLHDAAGLPSLSSQLPLARDAFPVRQLGPALFLPLVEDVEEMNVLAVCAQSRH